MAIYTIIRVYEVPGKNQIEATDRMMTAVTLGVENDFHIKDIIRAPEGKPGSGKKIFLTPPRGWYWLLIDQLLGDR